MPAAPPPKKKITLAPLVAAAYFMVAGGPYGLEELLARAGVRGALLILALVPLLWSLPTALVVGELASALPEAGGYYAWVRRALGPFAGFLEAWLSLSASVFDMAIYPTLFVLYLARLWPALEGATMPLGAAMIAACVLWNLRGARAVGGAALVMSVLLLAPFVVLSLLSLLSPGPAGSPAVARSATAPGALLPGLVVAMWNYMGWDNASTIASEVEQPQRTYPTAMLLAVALVTLTYLVPVAALGRAGIDPAGWTTGSWVEAGRALAGPPLALAVVCGGVLCAFGMANALVLSYSRLPAVLAEDGWLPSGLGRRDPRTGAPVAAVIACGVAYVLALRLGFVRLVALDVLLYGLGLVLEFVALVVLRVREPELPRPFRVPGGLGGAALIGVLPTALLAVALLSGESEADGLSAALAPAALVLASGLVVYAAARLSARHARKAAG